MFAVYENGKPCSVEGFRVHPSWKTHKLASFAEALAYAKKWVGEWDTSIPANWDGKRLKYNCFGDSIEIKEAK